MPEKTITKIRVGKHEIGIAGLTHTLGEACDTAGDKSDEELTEEIFAKLSKKNYIASSARERYKKAFLREYKKFVGLPVEEERPDGLVIKVLGPGCSQCDRMEREILKILAETALPADFDHVRDIKEIAQYGVMGMPALVINGEVKCYGRMPSAKKLQEMILETVESGK